MIKIKNVLIESKLLNYLRIIIISLRGETEFLFNIKINNLIELDHQLDILKSQYNMFLKIITSKNNKKKLTDTMLFIIMKGQSRRKTQPNLDVKQILIVNVLFNKNYITKFKVATAMQLIQTALAVNLYLIIAVV